MQDAVSGLVSPADLERLLAALEGCSARPVLGLFGAESVSWKINREAALFLAAGRAALLQLAHPWVAAGIAEHSRTLHDPIGRFHQTFRVMFAMVFGPTDFACATARHLYQRHSAVRGVLPETAGRFTQGTPYFANELSALRWVYATLVDSALLAYELVLPPLSPSEVEQYYAESFRTAALFGIPAGELPPSWTDFRRYFDDMLLSRELGVSGATRGMAQQLQAGVGLPVPPPFWYRALTISLLPARLRQEFVLEFGERESGSAQRALRYLRSIYPRLPALLRYVGPYNEIRGRIAGRTHPSLLISLSNRFWIGQASLFPPAPRR